MRASEISLSESFDSDIKGQLVRATPDLFTTEAVIGDRKIVFNASKYEDESDASIWEIEFIEKTPGNASYGKTGSGNQMQVFSFVIESIKELVSRYKPSVLEFGSHKADGNRSALYRRMLNRIKLPGYSLGDTLSDKHTDIFRLIRDDHR